MAERRLIWGEDVPAGTRSLEELKANSEEKVEEKDQFEGPLSSTHWVLPGVVMCGSSGKD